MEASKSLARRRLRLSQARVRSTTQRRGRTSKPTASAVRLTISRLQRPNLASACKKLVTGIGAVGEEVAQPWEEVVNGLDDEGCAIAVLHIGRVDRSADHQADGIGHDMALATLDLLGRIVAAWSAALGRFHRLAVDHAGRGARFATGPFARL